MSRRNSSIILNWPILLFFEAPHSVLPAGGSFRFSNPRTSFRPLRIFRNTKVHSLIKPYIPRTFVQERSLQFIYTLRLTSAASKPITRQRAIDFTRTKMNRQLPKKKFTQETCLKPKWIRLVPSTKVHFKYETIYSKRTLLNYISDLLQLRATLYILIAGQSTDCRRFRCAVSPKSDTTHDDTAAAASLSIRYTTSLHFNRKMYAVFFSFLINNT